MALKGVVKDRWASTSRKITFVAGLLGIGYETVYEKADRPWLLLAFLTMMGLAQFSRVFEFLGQDDGVTITLDKKSQRSQKESPVSGEEGSTS